MHGMNANRLGRNLDPELVPATPMLKPTGTLGLKPLFKQNL